MSEDFNNYLRLLPISSEEKNYAASFFKRKEYLETLNNTAIQFNLGEGALISGKGNCNSRIVVAIDNYQNKELVVKFIAPMFHSINTSLWNIYITSIIKGNGDTEVFNTMFMHEMNAVKPEIILMFDEQKSFEITDYMIGNKSVKTVHVNVHEMKEMLTPENEKTLNYNSFMNEFYQHIVSLIPLREIEILE